MATAYPRLVGLDLSITGAGLVVQDWQTAKFDSWNIGTNSDWGPMIARLRLSTREILRKIPVNSLVYMEDYAFSIKAKRSSLASLAELGGIIKLAVYQKTALEVLMVSSSQVKAWLGSGKMKREMIPVAAYRKLGQELPTHDEYVAYVLADIGYHVASKTPRRTLTKYEEKAIGDLRKKAGDARSALRNWAERSETS